MKHHEYCGYEETGILTIFACNACKIIGNKMWTSDEPNYGCLPKYVWKNYE